MMGAQIVRVGPGAARFLPRLLDRFAVRKVALVAGEGGYERSGASGMLARWLGRHEVVRISQFAENVDLLGLEKSLKLLSGTAPDAVVGIGGGTAMDLAKLVAVFAGDPQGPRRVIRRLQAIPARTPLLALIPTTSGTGAEATPFSTVYVDGEKFSIEGSALIPDLSLVDPELTESVPSLVRASSGLDALCQSIESLWSIRSTARSRATARHALELCSSSLESACRDANPRALQRMSQAAHLSGIAIATSRTTAAHAMSYALTSRFGLRHGHACALLLPALLSFNARVSSGDTRDPRGPAFVRARIAEAVELLGFESPERAAVGLRDTIARLGLANRLSAVGCRSSDAASLAESALGSNRADNNPRRLSRSDLLAMVRASL